MRLTPWKKHFFNWSIFQDSNWPSASEEKDDLHRLVREAEAKGFCRVVTRVREAKKTLGQDPILNKLGVVVKYPGSGSWLRRATLRAGCGGRSCTITDDQSLVTGGDEPASWVSGSPKAFLAAFGVIHPKGAQVPNTLMLGKPSRWFEQWKRRPLVV